MSVPYIGFHYEPFKMEDSQFSCLVSGTNPFNGRSMCILLNAGWDASVNLYSNDW